MMEQLTVFETVQLMIQNALANVHTTTIAKVTKVNDKSINCQPTINRVIDKKEIQLPEFVNVPLITLQGGGSYIHFPVKVGDYVLLFFNERCFDNWYDGRDFVAPLEKRTHDYSDAFAISGVNNKNTSYLIPDKIRLIGDMESEGDHEHTGTTTYNGDIEVNGDIVFNGNVTINGNLKVSGKIDADMEITAMAAGPGVKLSTHMHTGNLGAPTSPPTPGT
jgi:hypothetical protein